MQRPQLSTGSPTTLWSKTGRAIFGAVLAALVLQFAPYLEPLRWAPDDALAFVPRLFRPGAFDQAADDEALSEDFDDEALIALGPPEGAPRPKRKASRAAHRDDGEGDAGAPPDAGFIIESNADLPDAPDIEETASGVPLYPIEDHQHALRRFHTALDRVRAGDPEAVARVLHYGDSLIAGDYVTQTVRRLMQKKFGDAGHGFVLAGRPTRWYRRNNLKLWSSDGWTINRMTNPTIADGRYGLGGMTFRTSRAGQWVRFEPEGEDGLNDGVAKMQVFYLGQPAGGRFEIEVDGRGVEVNTRIDEAKSRLAEVQVPDGPHVLRVKTLGGGEVRLFGAVLERPGPGVVYDSLGVDGARAKLLKRMDPPHWHDQLRLRHPDLLVLHYGTNESQWRNLSADTYRADLAQTVGHLRQALPGVSCLMVGPMDRAEREGGKLRTMPVVKRIVRVQREVAFAQGCAFWNAFEAMGGEGSMAQWYRHRPQLAGGDLTHPTRKGAERIGAMLFAALMDSYSASREAP